ncbi:MAG: GNAT family N-acetyltransferase [Geobacteraceae bacterium]|nr:GNAT family N-acetyltransferase [Geobacteraceae bacterium]
MIREEVRIRRMNRDDIDVAVAWAAGEGWNPGLYDADAFLAADPDGFFIAEIQGDPVGCISAVSYDDIFGFMGFYIVKKELRHLGIGMKLWNASLDYMGSRTIGADGVVTMLDKYAQFDFRIAHYNARYEGIGKEAPLALTDIFRVPFPALEQYDRRFFPASRTAFLESWISRPGSCGRVVSDNGSITGYGVIRPCCRGYKIAPLFADTPEIAEELFAALSGLAAGQPVFFDIPVCNQAAVKLVERQGMNKVFETARIYRGTPPDLPLDSIYGITSFELG